MGEVCTNREFSVIASLIPVAWGIRQIIWIHFLWARLRASEPGAAAEASRPLLRLLGGGDFEHPVTWYPHQRLSALASRYTHLESFKNCLLDPIHRDSELVGLGWGLGCPYFTVAPPRWWYVHSALRTTGLRSSSWPWQTIDQQPGPLATPVGAVTAGLPRLWHGGWNRGQMLFASTNSLLRGASSCDAPLLV